jgi:predicted RNA-binding protein
VCLANVYMQEGDRQDAVMQDVAWISAEGDGLRVTSLFGESILLQAQVKSVDLMKSRVVLKATVDAVRRALTELDGKGA